VSIDLATARHRVTAALAALAVAVLVTLPASVHGTEKHAAPEAAAAQKQEEAKPPSAQPAAAPSRQESDTQVRRGTTRLAMPLMNPARGRELFVTKGCFACHAINGVGGHDATNLDAHTMETSMNPFDFAAKMWTMAPFMIAAQEEALGEQILFSGEELADIIAFVHDDEEQHKFSARDIPPDLLKLMDHAHGKVPAHQEEVGHEHGEGTRHDD
jgi:cytochrome c2